MDLIKLKTFLHKDLHFVYSQSNCYAIVTDNVSKEILWTEKAKTLEDLEVASLLFENVAVYVINKQFTLLPTALLKEEHAREYLKYTTNLAINDLVLTDKEELSKIALIWALKKEDKDEIITKHKQAVFHNFIKSLISRSNGLKGENRITTFFVADLLIVLVSKNGEFQFVNIFEIESIEDALYYHLLTLQSLELEESEVSVYTGGFYSGMSDFLVKMESYFSNVNRFTAEVYKEEEQAFLDLASIIN